MKNNKKLINLQILDHEQDNNLSGDIP